TPNPTGESGGIILAAIPEPETYAMMLAGLGLMGFVARRRRQK
ncbi:MAG: PEP-CTERM sorting domain-containing protein, partial [Betaproteobacteria bacterium]|nr:PEP-CTERM sorting domain-containing protein [Betaproteobacteria bacterium]